MFLIFSSLFGSSKAVAAHPAGVSAASAVHAPTATGSASGTLTGVHATWHVGTVVATGRGLPLSFLSMLNADVLRVSGISATDSLYVGTLTADDKLTVLGMSVTE